MLTLTRCVRGGLNSRCSVLSRSSGETVVGGVGFRHNHQWPERKPTPPQDMENVSGFQRQLMVTVQSLRKLSPSSLLKTATDPLVGKAGLTPIGRPVPARSEKEKWEEYLNTTDPETGMTGREEEEYIDFVEAMDEEDVKNEDFELWDEEGEMENVDTGPISLNGPFGTPTDPVMVQSMEGDRIVGCVGGGCHRWQ